MTKSSFCKIPQQWTISTSDVEPSNNSLTNLIGPEGHIPIKPFQ